LFCFVVSTLSSCMRFEVFMAVSIIIMVTLDVMSCSLVEGY
jgi:hypothetical protein